MVISTRLLCTNANQEHSYQTWNEALGCVVVKSLVESDGSNYVFFTVVGYNRIFLNDRKLVTGSLIPVLGNSLSFAFDFQKQKQEMTQVK